MTAGEQPIIYLQPHLSSEPTLSMNSGALEEGLNNSNNTLPPSSNAAAANIAAVSSPQWIKRHALTLTFAFLVLCGVVFSAVVFRPGGPGNPKTMESNLASITRGTDTTPTDGDGEFNVRTDVPTDAPTEEEDDDAPEEEEIDTPETVVPTPAPTLDATSVVPTPSPPTFNVTSVAPTPSPTLNVTSVAPTPPPTVNATVNVTVPTVEPTTFKPTLLSPTPPPVELTAYPTTGEPTVLITDSSTETVNTEATGAPTLPDRND